MSDVPTNAPRSTSGDGIPKTLAELTGGNFFEKSDLAVRVADRIVLAYRRNPVEVARVCDEVIDRSGNLLGWVRDLARVV